jgi:predicted DNA-binding protein (UPF0278 family)
MTKQFKSIHMPTTFYTEIENFTHQPDTQYKTVAEICRTAGKMLINHYNLRQDETFYDDEQKK